MLVTPKLHLHLMSSIAHSDLLLNLVLLTSGDVSRTEGLTPPLNQGHLSIMMWAISDRAISDDPSYVRGGGFTSPLLLSVE